MERREQPGSSRNEKVLNCLYQNPDAVFKLICFPWAGGGSVYFAKWGQKIHDSLEVHSVRLAGRESRFEEPFAKDIHQVVDEIVCAMLPVIQDKPFAFFGHSMGSYIAFMTALHLKEKYQLEPMHFFVSSITPPHSKAQVSIPKEGELSEEQIVHYLMAFGGTPKNFIEDKELLQQYIPLLKADIHIIRTWIFDKPSEAVLSCDLTCFIGSEDIIKDMEAWKDLTSGSFNVLGLPGDHFHLMKPDNEKFIKNYITKCLEIASLADC
ncbi:S-acyl fatty acid synthase thioesterase, medium chain isoform X2 [Nycticebus coucang]|nr:S-acyl fatty acid synthase thioesterase, medium chain isoform X2 [Nycticebus coucang]XP_053429215.1 S-acyl fatty acid synthase thioesterase, medium chain isoform X2 [Nycticebus coucang]XP_053429216.1 S-acyl fatty acid synthase thioesterase, medium chain isoform X2 [Nycticebus coucang]